MNKVAFGDIWLVNYSPSIGHEYQKIRPAVIVSPDSLLGRSNLFTCIAVTGRVGRILPDDVDLPKTAVNKLYKDSVLKMHHVTSYDKRRLYKHIGAVDAGVLALIKDRMKEMFELS